MLTLVCDMVTEVSKIDHDKLTKDTKKQVASRYGINLVDMLHLRNRVNSSKILKALQHKVAFKLAFGITFALSAFMTF